MKIDLSRFRGAFFQEAAEHVDNMEAALLSLDPESADPEALNTIFRAAHSIKGASGTFAFDDVTQFTHRLEELLDGMRQGRVDPTAERVQLLLQSCDMLRSLLSAADAGTAAPDGMREMLAALTVAQRSGNFLPEQAPQVRESDKTASRQPKIYRILFRPSPNIFHEGMDPLLVLRELREIGSVQEIVSDLAQIPELEALEPDICYLSWTVRLETAVSASEIQDVFAFVEDGAEIKIEEEKETAEPPSASVAKAGGAIASAPRQVARDSGSIRVATEKVDELINLVGELLISHSMAVDVADHFTPARIAELQSALSEVGRNTRELQERVMGIRMLPVGTIFARLSRAVHDIANSEHKQIRMETAGEDTELDKAVLEGIVDPLTHLVRNAADHGVESPEERRAAGKPEQGTIALRARHEGGSFALEISDDGHGLNLERIRQKALERGLISASQELTEEEIQAFIFHPGFSTAQTVSEVSGRGVGMDVVRRNVEALGGIVTLKSREGLGTTVTIKLPLTLAILDGQLVRVGDESYVLPLVSIVESIRPTAQQVRTVAGQGEVVTVRQEPLPLLRLHELFGVHTDVRDPSRGLVAIVEHAGRRVALLVDELLGQQQVVIKSLQSNFRKVEGTMGATILGDGRVSLILDVAGLVELSRRKINSPGVRFWAAAAGLAHQQQNQPIQ